MPISFRHDAAAVALPSNNAGRKYGQQLVLQQQQQKYQSTQAGYDRLFQLGRDVQQNQFQAARDAQQNAFAVQRGQQQNNFMLERDRAEFERAQQVAEAERQRKFMEDARQQSGRFIMDAIEAGEYDPQTARELRQNLIDEAEALGNPNLDATQRAEALQAIRARRTILSANRQPKAPPPTPQEQFEQSVVTDPETGMRFRQNAKGDYEPLPEQKKMPSTAAEAFGADPKLRKDYMDQALEIITKKGQEPLTPEKRKQAADLAMELWQGDNTPSAAPPLPNAAQPAEAPMEKSILEQDQGIPVATPDQGVPPSPAQQIPVTTPDQGVPPSPATPNRQQAPGMPGMFNSPEEYDAYMTSRGYELVTPGDGRRPYYYKDSRPAPEAATAPTTPTPPGPAKNPWVEVAGGEAQAVIPKAATPPPTATMPTAPTATQPNAAQPGAQSVAPPNFTEMLAKHKSNEDRRLIQSLQGIYSKQSPEVQSAIGVLLNEGASLEDTKAAYEMLISAGIDVDKLATYQPPRGGRKGKNK